MLEFLQDLSRRIETVKHSVESQERRKQWSDIKKLVQRFLLRNNTNIIPRHHLVIELCRIREALVGKTGKLYILPDERTYARSINDILFNIVSNKGITQQQCITLPTQLFHDFMKGITWFETDACCGSKNNSLRICYIKRTIYDLIYKHIFGFQDLDYVVELENTARLYKKYFPSDYIKIDLSFDKIPKKLTIKTSKCVETYVKLNNYVKYNKVLKVNKRSTKEEEWVQQQK
jgi:hypothetical protein